MLSIFFNRETVFFNFDQLLELMIRFNFGKVDKKSLRYDRLCIVGCNEQVFVTDGVNMDVRAVLHDECYVSFDGAFELMDLNMFGDKEGVERALVECAARVVKSEDHAWRVNYVQRLRGRVQASFNIYFKVLEQYMLLNQPCVDRIGKEISALVRAGEQLKNSADYQQLITAHQSFDKASILMMQNI
jgi:hypothetical protein